MEDRRARRERILGLAHDRELAPIDAHPFGRVLGDGPGFGGDRDDGLALPARAIDGKRVLRRRA